MQIDDVFATEPGLAELVLRYATGAHEGSVVLEVYGRAAAVSKAWDAAVSGGPALLRALLEKVGRNARATGTDRVERLLHRMGGDRFRESVDRMMRRKDGAHMAVTTDAREGIIVGTAGGLRNVLLTTGQDVSVAADTLAPVRPGKKDLCVVMRGYHYEAHEGRVCILIGIDGEDGIIRVKANGDIRILPMEALCKLRPCAYPMPETFDAMLRVEGGSWGRLRARWAAHARWVAQARLVEERARRRQGRIWEREDEGRRLRRRRASPQRGGSVLQEIADDQ